MSLELAEQFEETLESYCETFYQIEGVDPDLLPEIDIEMERNPRVTEHMIEEDNELKVVLHPNLRSIEHRFSEGYLDNVDLESLEYQCMAIHGSSHALFENCFRTNPRYRDLQERLDEIPISRNVVKAGLRTLLNAALHPFDSRKEQERLLNGDISLGQYRNFGNRIIDNRIQSMEREFGQEAAQDYQELIGLGGIDETLARLMEIKLKDQDPSLASLYETREGLEKYFGFHLGSTVSDIAYLNQNRDVMNVKTEQLYDFVKQNDLNQVLSMTSEEVLDNFYDKVN